MPLVQISTDEVYGSIAEGSIQYVEDRPGHDRRYSLSDEKLKREIGWQAQVQFDDGIEKTVRWYLDNKSWWEPIIDGDYRAYYERQYGTKIS